MRDAASGASRRLTVAMATPLEPSGCGLPRVAEGSVPDTLSDTAWPDAESLPPPLSGGAWVGLGVGWSVGLGVGGSVGRAVAAGSKSVLPLLAPLPGPVSAVGAGVG